MEAEAVHVLIVEEDAAERDRVRRSLGEMGDGLTVSEASTLSEATAVLEHAHIDVVLLAMNIGGEPGLALCTDRERSRNPSVAFIVLAEENDAQRAREALHQGAHDYLVKGEAPRARCAEPCATRGNAAAPSTSSSASWRRSATKASAGWCWRWPMRSTTPRPGRSTTSS